jgi:phosphoenolpyruvate carboxylase
MDRFDREIGTSGGLMLMSMPWLRHFPFFSSVLNKLDRDLKLVLAFIDRQIEKKIAQRSEEPQSFVDHFLAQMDSEVEDEKAKYFRYLFHLNLLIQIF